jgi:hypothetical protein
LYFRKFTLVYYPAEEAVVLTDTYYSVSGTVCVRNGYGTLQTLDQSCGLRHKIFPARPLLAWNSRDALLEEIREEVHAKTRRRQGKCEI